MNLTTGHNPPIAMSPRPKFPRGWSTAVGDLKFEAVSLPAGYRLGHHSHLEPHFCVVVNGSFVDADRKERRRCERGTARVSAAGDEHTIELGREGADCLVIFLDPKMPDEHPADQHLRKYMLLSESLAGIVQRAYRTLAS